MEPTPPVTPAFPQAPQPPLARQPGWPRAHRVLAAGHGVAWWSEGWRVFMANPWLWIGIVVVLGIILVLMGLVPFLGYVAQMLLWPVFAGGLMLGCHALAQGRPLQFNHLFAGFGEGRTGPLVILGLIALAINAVIALIMIVLVFGAMGLSGFGGVLTGDPAKMMSSAIAGASAGALIGGMVLLGVFVLFLMAWWFATPLVALNGAQPVAALKSSFNAALGNLGAIVVCWLILIALAIVATIPLGLGWLVLAPVAIGMTYASWREVFGE